MTKKVSELSVPELKAMAKFLGMKRYSKLNKPELIKAIDAFDENKLNPDITDIVQVDIIFKIKGKSGLWTPLARVRSRNHVVQFANVLDQNIRTTAFKGFKSMADDVHMLASFNAAYKLEITIDEALESANKFTEAEKKQYKKYYEILLELIEIGKKAKK